jgi:hypothetical protein
MTIEASIEYWDENVLTFDPEKVAIRLRKYFTQVLIDPKDYSMDELERFIKYANENIEEPNRSRMISSMRGKNWANGPTFRFKIPLENEIEITGHTKRYRIAFESKQDIDSETEKTIIDFLKSLKYGEIRSDTQTKYFGKLHEDYKDRWLLE